MRRRSWKLCWTVLEYWPVGVDPQNEFAAECGTYNTVPHKTLGISNIHVAFTCDWCQSIFSLVGQIQKIWSINLHQCIFTFTFTTAEGNEFVNSREGIDFVINIAAGIPNLRGFSWLNNPINNLHDAMHLFEGMNNHPSISMLSFWNCCGEDVDGYFLLHSILTQNNKCIVYFSPGTMFKPTETIFSQIPAVKSSFDIFAFRQQFT